MLAAPLESKNSINRAVFKQLPENQHQTVKGIVVEQEETKIPQFADNATTVPSDVDSAYDFYELLEIVRQVSGLKLVASLILDILPSVPYFRRNY